ncbi:MAG TPA: hypothetical protein VLJ14_03020 [Ktedonobacterales bacterium]|nr:hypothetical protein [Ktedonobacterales bacterium]
MGKSVAHSRLDTDVGARGANAQPLSRARSAARKVPEVTIFFWIIKLLTTGMGETTSDYLVFHINPYLAVALGGIGLVTSLLLQLLVRRYVAWIYWLAVVMVAIFGTMAADVVHIVLGVPYLDSSVAFAAALAVIFVSWYATEKTLSIHSIYTPRRELFYWATIMATFALGTAVGDMTASTFGLGYFASGLLFAALFALPALGYRLFRLNAIFAFWFAYVMTRPLGASFADWFGKPRSISGLGLGTGLISLILAVVIIGFVGYLTVTHVDVKDTATSPRR